MADHPRHDDERDEALRERAEQPPDPNDPLVLELRQAEARRRMITIGMAIVVVIAAIAGTWAIVKYREAFFRPQMPIAASEAEIYSQTNDPACRQIIADVTATGQTFFDEEANIERHLLAENAEQTSTTLETVSALRMRIEQAKSRTDDAVLRFDESREQLDRWFEFTLNELALLERLGTAHRDALEPVEGQEPREDGPKAAPARADTRPPEELRDRSLLAIHDSFQNFRVWHTSGLHPCGQAPEGTKHREETSETPSKPASAASESDSLPDSLLDSSPAPPPSAGGDPDPEKDLLPFPEREFEGVPFREEHHRMRVFWNGEKTRLTTCRTPSEAARCEAHGPIVETGDELTWKYSIIRVKPRILTAKHEAEIIIHGQPMTLKAGTAVALYAYQGEGTCAIASGHLYDEATTCPLPEDFDNYPPRQESTARTLAPQTYVWWVERDEGWIRIRPEQVRIEFESML